MPIDRSSNLGRLLLTMAAFVIVVTGLKAAEPIIVPFLLSVFIAILCGPPLAWMRKRGIPQAAALLVIVLGIVLLFGGMATLIGRSVQDFSANAAQYESLIGAEQAKIERQLWRMGAYDPWTPTQRLALEAREVAGFDPDAGLEDDASATKSGSAASESAGKTGAIRDNGKKKNGQQEAGQKSNGKKSSPNDADEPANEETLIGSLFGSLNAESVFSQVVALFSRLSTLLTNSFLILLTVVFLLLETASLPRKLECAFDEPEAWLGNLSKIAEDINRYMAIKTAVSLAVGLGVAILLIACGVDYPLLWGLLAFILNFIPNIGSIIAAVPAILLAYLQYASGGQASETGYIVVIVVIGYVLINVIVGMILEPRVMGRGLGLSTLVVFLSLVFWGWVLGPVGMLLSVPLTISIKIALQSFDDTRWIGVLLGPENPVVSPVPELIPPAAPTPTAQTSD